jgi:signal transduction protein with GAF and PtsI domain
MKTPPDFEAPRAARYQIGSASEDLRHLVAMMERVEGANATDHRSIFETLIEMKADRAWMRRLMTVSGGLLAALAAAVITIILHGAAKLDAIEEKIGDHIDQRAHRGMAEFGERLQQDIERNTAAIERIEDRVYIGPQKDNKKD